MHGADQPGEAEPRQTRLGSESPPTDRARSPARSDEILSSGEVRTDASLRRESGHV
jgi:hypothetical protein